MQRNNVKPALRLTAVHSQHRHQQASHTVTVSGEVERPRTLDLHAVAKHNATQAIVDLHCHEGWSRLRQSYRAITLAAVLHLAGARPGGRYVTVASGRYSVVLTREQAEDRRVLLALEHDGVPLSGPRLIGPAEWDCFLSVKDVDRIELTRTPQRATGPSIALARIGH